MQMGRDHGLAITVSPYLIETTTEWDVTPAAADQAGSRQPVPTLPAALRISFP